MAKLFQQQVEERGESPVEHKKLVPGFFLKAMMGLMVIVVFTIISVFVIEEKKERDKNKNNMELARIIEMDNGTILTRQVKYVTFKKTDPEDTSDIFYEVVNGDKKYTEGMLVKFNHRFIQPQQIEGETYCVIETSQIQFHLKKEHVKADLLKR